MSALFGFTGTLRDSPQALLQRMAAAAGADREDRQFAVASGAALGAAGCAQTVAGASADEWRLVLVGHAHLAGAPARQPDPNALAAVLLDDFRASGAAALDALHGDFALAVHDAGTGTTHLAIDRHGVHSLCYQAGPAGLIFGSTLDAIACHPQARLRLRLQSIYDYLFFHVIPGPATVYEEVQRLPPGCMLTWADGAVRVEPYWRMEFREQPVADRAALKQQFVRTLEEATRRTADGANCGAFLSGGTDSSTIAGMLARVGRRARTYSIGFDVPGYDEMHYARIAARHFGTEHHEYYVAPRDVLEAAPIIACSYDQPFGNASAIPTYFCARLARADGVNRLLAGDGGDELFGGNARYAKQQLLALYHRLPAGLRSALIEPLLLRNASATRWPPLRKLRSYVEQAHPLMPQRYETYNLLEHLGPERVFTADFLGAVDRDAPHQLLREVHAPFREASLINQMLGIDLRMTLADNDLRKVTGMCALAGVDVAFPMLDDELVAFSATLPAPLKLRRTRLRFFFKEALADFLPQAIIRKTKHGFGLPIGHWLAGDRALGELAGDNLAWLRSRAIVRPQFIDELSGPLLQAHPAYYGTMVWLLLVLALWMQSRQDRHGLTI